MRVNASSQMPGCNIASIVGKYEGHLAKFGEVYLYDDGTAAVYDDLWGDPTRYFDGKDGHHRAMVAIVTRIAEDCELVW